MDSSRPPDSTLDPRGPEPQVAPPVSAEDALAPELIASFAPGEARESRALRIAFIALGAALMVASLAAADVRGSSDEPKAAAESSGAMASHSKEAPSPAASALDDQIEAAIAPLLAPGVRLQRLTLGCKPPADAVLQGVAPGASSIQSRGVVVLFLAGNRTIACGATIDAQKQILVAAHDIDFGAPVSSADFSAQWVDAFMSAPGTTNSFPTGVPYNATTMIRAGQPLFQNSLARPIAVHPGDLVTVVVKNGAVTVRTQLLAQSQASVGDPATMINPASSSPVQVTVTGNKEAELVLQ